MTFDEICELAFQKYYQRDMESERFKALPESEKGELLERGRANNRAVYQRTIDRLQARDITLALNGTFHPSNGFSRMLWALVVGSELPKGANDTREAVKEYIGRDKLAAHFESIESSKREEEERKQAIENQRLEAIAVRIRAGESVSGAELADCCAYLSIDIHPRTIGTLRQRVVAIDSNGAKVRQTRSGTSALSNEPYRAYMACATSELAAK